VDATCSVCTKVFPAKRSTAKFCGPTCRSRANRTGGTVAVLPEHPSGLVAVTKRELEAAGRLDTVLGQQAMELAGRIVSPFSTGAAVGTLSKELRTVMSEALKGAAVVADPLDELRDRRDRKRNAG